MREFPRGFLAISLLLVSCDQQAPVSPRTAENTAITEAADTPVLGGNYIQQRKRLAVLGFVPAKTDGTAFICNDKECVDRVALTEGDCAVDVPLCNFFWRSSDGRILKVRTKGEIERNVFAGEWVDPSELDL